jgi:D-beta-D-heptose 7-phosphate kinase/D-beta-D-heptose 1-phosphate adenosyltransferase
VNRRTLLDALEKLAGGTAPKVVLFGDLILDEYIHGDVGRVSPEAPIPILSARRKDLRLGGAGNVAANLGAMEARVEAVGLVGDDEAGEQLLALLREEGLGTDHCLNSAGRPTTRKVRMLSGAQQMLRVDWEVADELTPEQEEQLGAALAAALPGAGALVLSDYGKGALTPALCQRAIQAARAAGVPVLVDPKGSDYDRYHGATLVTPNRREAEEATGRRIASYEDASGAAQHLLTGLELEAAVVTMGSKGILFRQRDGSEGRVAAQARDVYDVTGAGDTVVAQLALGLAAGFPFEVAVGLANAAASIVVERLGATAVTLGELAARLILSEPPRGKILDGDTLDGALEAWRAEGKRLVFTNGCFDLLHVGHVDYLRQARERGDVLIVGVNDDASITRLKGQGRPVNQLEDRMAVLAALEMVDAVIAFSEDTPQRLVERVTPDVLVKGEDWAEKGVVGREWVEAHGGQVVLVPLVPGRSTTGMLARAEMAPGGSGGCGSASSEGEPKGR